MESTTHIKFENSPADSIADSFVSTPGTAYPPLFNDAMSPMEAMTPQSYDEENFRDSMDPSVAGTPAPEKKQVKKRKSWGQQLPEPKTNLPPRKRAKTEDEKEQRRVERVLRNRRAAQSSRERKRQEVEKLEAEKTAVERRAKDLELRLADMEARNAMLQRQIDEISGGNMTVFGSSSAVSSPVPELRQSSPRPVTFTQTIFGQQETESRPISTQALPQTPVKTVNPASLSPDLRPVAESSNAKSSDLTQHPAAMLCDLQCQSEEPRPWMDSTSTMGFRILVTTLLLTLSTEVFSTIVTPLTQIINSLKTTSPLSPTTSILNLIIWLTTTPAPLTTTSMNSSTTTTSSRPRFSLRMSLLRRLLACSPNLARPLKDATMVAMRLASEQQLQDRFSTADLDCRQLGNSPSLEALMTLLWAIHCIEKERDQDSTLPQLDAAAEGEREMGLAFRPINKIRGREISYVKHGRRSMMGSGQSKKSLDDWRPAFDGPHGH